MVRLSTKLLILISGFALTIDVSAQCLLDRHNTSISDGWLSCDRRQSPNTSRGFSHWVLYEFVEPKEITTLKFWNVNHPEHLMDGAKEIIIDHSMDGKNWTEASTIELEVGDGKPIYQGGAEIDIPDVRTQYLLLTMKSNYGGSCVGFSEVRFGLSDQTTSTKESIEDIRIKVFPNPFSERITVNLEDIQPGTYRYDLISTNGQTIMRSEPFTVKGSHQFDINGSNLAAGMYWLKVFSKEAIGVRELSVIHPK